MDEDTQKQLAEIKAMLKDNQASVELTRNSKGAFQFTVKAYAPTPEEALELVEKAEKQLREKYPA